MNFDDEFFDLFEWQISRFVTLCLIPVNKTGVIPDVEAEAEANAKANAEAGADAEADADREANTAVDADADAGAASTGLKKISREERR